MKKQLKGFVIGVLVTLILTSTIAFAGGVKQKIDVMFNSINITVNGNPVKADNILYKGTTYVPLRAVGEMLGKEVGWNQKTNTSSINDKGFKESPKVSKESKSNDFRNVKWGMTIEEVKKNENAEFVSLKGNILAYRTRVLNYDVGLIYYFNDEGKLYESGYILDEIYTNKNDYINAYDSLGKELISKHGKPVEDDVIWLDDLFKDNYKDWGLAISVGHLALMSTWDVGDTEILAMLHGNNYEISLGIIYSSKSIKAPEIDSGL